MLVYHTFYYISIIKQIFRILIAVLVKLSNKKMGNWDDRVCGNSKKTLGCPRIEKDILEIRKIANNVCSRAYSAPLQILFAIFFLKF